MAIDGGFAARQARKKPWDKPRPLNSKLELA
jgi:hypothetical protein